MDKVKGMYVTPHRHMKYSITVCICQPPGAMQYVYLCVCLSPLSMCALAYLHIFSLPTLFLHTYPPPLSLSLSLFLTYLPIFLPVFLLTFLFISSQIKHEASQKYPSSLDLMNYEIQLCPSSIFRSGFNTRPLKFYQLKIWKSSHLSSHGILVDSTFSAIIKILL